MSNARPQKRDIQWADGIRGIACFLVLTAHGMEAFGRPQTAFSVPFPLALPFVRLLFFGGYMAVGIFFIMSGYVCSIKPLKLAREGKADDARKNIAASAFRRVVRLGIPASIATTISWGLCQMGGFNMAHERTSTTGWLYFQSPWQSRDWPTAVKDLIWALLHTWTYDGETWSTVRNRYENIQWTLAIELRGSLMCYLVLIVTANFTPYWRRVIFLILLSWSIYWGDLLAEIPFYIGALLADMSTVLSQKQNTISTVPPRYERLQRYWPMAVGIFSLFICSYPPNWAELARWSHLMMRLGTRFFHSNWETRWAYAVLGSAMLIFSLHFSPFLRRIFSFHYPVFFGSISFPVYLIHSFLMRSVLVWIVFGIIPEGPLVIRYTLMLMAFLAWFAMVTYLSMIWRDRIDPACASVTQFLESVMVGKKTFGGLLGGINVWRGRDNGIINEKDVKVVNGSALV